MSKLLRSIDLPFSLTENCCVDLDRSSNGEWFWIAGVDEEPNRIIRINLTSLDIDADETVSHDEITSITYRYKDGGGILYVGDSSLNTSTTANFAIYTATDSSLTLQPLIQLSLESFSSEFFQNSLETSLTIVSDELVDPHQWWYLFKEKVYRFQENNLVQNENLPALPQWIGRYVPAAKRSISVDWERRQIYISQETEIYKYDFGGTPLGVIRIPNNQQMISQVVFNTFSDSIFVFFSESDVVVELDPHHSDTLVNTVLGDTKKDRVTIGKKETNQVKCSIFDHELKELGGTKIEYSFLKALDLSSSSSNALSSSSSANVFSLIDNRKETYWSSSNSVDYWTINLGNQYGIHLIEIDYECLTNNTLIVESANIDQGFSAVATETLEATSRTTKIWGVFNQQTNFTSHYIRLIAQSGLKIYQLKLYTLGSEIGSIWDRFLQNTVTSAQDQVLKIQPKNGVQSDCVLHFNVTKLESLTSPVKATSIDSENFLLPEFAKHSNCVLVFREGLLVDSEEYSIVDNLLTFEDEQSEDIYVSYTLKTPNSPAGNQVISLENTSLDLITYDVPEVSYLSQDYLLFINGKLGLEGSSVDVLPGGEFYQISQPVISGTELIVDDGTFLTSNEYQLGGDLVTFSSTPTQAIAHGCVSDINGHLLKTNIALLGIKDETNQVFLIPEQIVLETELIWFNSELLIRDINYTINNNVVQLYQIAPSSSDTLYCSYQILDSMSSKVLTNIPLVEVSLGVYKIQGPLRLNPPYETSEFITDQGILLLRGIDYTVDNTGAETLINFILPLTSAPSLTEPVIHFSTSTILESSKFVTNQQVNIAEGIENRYIVSNFGNSIRLLKKQSSAPVVQLVYTEFDNDPSYVYNRKTTELVSAQNSLQEFLLPLDRSSHFLLWKEDELLIPTVDYTVLKNSVILTQPIDPTESIRASFSNNLKAPMVGEQVFSLTPIGEHDHSEQTMILRVGSGSIFGLTDLNGKLQADYFVGDTQGVETIKISGNSTGFDVLRVQSDLREVGSLSTIQLTSPQTSSSTFETNLTQVIKPTPPSLIDIQLLNDRIVLDWEQVLTQQSKSTQIYSDDQQAELLFDDGTILNWNYSTIIPTKTQNKFTGQSVVGRSVINQVKEYLSKNGIWTDFITSFTISGEFLGYCSLGSCRLTIETNGKISHLNIEDFQRNLLLTVAKAIKYSCQNDLLYLMTNSSVIVVQNTGSDEIPVLQQQVIFSSVLDLTCFSYQNVLLVGDVNGGFNIASSRVQLSNHSLLCVREFDNKYYATDTNGQVFELNTDLTVSRGWKFKSPITDIFKTDKLRFVDDHGFSYTAEYKKEKLIEILVNPYIRGYIVERTTDQSLTNWTRISDILTVPNFIDNNLEYNKTHFYRVKTVDQFSQISDSSCIVSVSFDSITLTDTPTEVNITNIHTVYGKRNLIKWNPVAARRSGEKSDRLFGYRVLRKSQMSPYTVRLHSTCDLITNYNYTVNLKTEDNNWLNDKLYSSANTQDGWFKWSGGRSTNLQSTELGLRLKTDQQFGVWTSDSLKAFKTLGMITETFVFINWSKIQVQGTIPLETQVKIWYRTSEDEKSWSSYRLYQPNNFRITDQYLQIKLELSTSDENYTPIIDQLKVEYFYEDKNQALVTSEIVTFDTNYLTDEPLVIVFDVKQQTDLHCMIFNMLVDKERSINIPNKLELEYLQGDQWIGFRELDLSNSQFVDGVVSIQLNIDKLTRYLRLKMYRTPEQAVWVDEIEFNRRIGPGEKVSTEFSDQTLNWGESHYVHYQVLAYETGNVIA